MKYIIGLFSELDLELQIGQGVDGIWRLTGMFPTFPNRPGKPHVSVFVDPNSTPHFTAYRNHPRAFRRDLTRTKNGKLWGLLVGAMDEAAARAMSTLRFVNMEELEREGWFVHFANPEVVGRWLATYLPWSGRVEFCESQAAGLFLHVLRTWIRPLAVPTLNGPGKALAVRIVGDEIEISPLFYFPRGIAIGNTIRPPGWYWNPNQDALAQPIELPAGLNAGQIGTKLKAYLDRFPRRNGTRAYDLPSGSWLRAIAFVLGFYGADLFDAALLLAIVRRVNSNGNRSNEPPSHVERGSATG